MNRNIDERWGTSIKNLPMLDVNPLHIFHRYFTFTNKQLIDFD